MAGLNHKVSDLNSPALRHAIETLSKLALVDLVADLARKELGEDATDEQIANKINEWHHPIAVARGDKTPNVAKELHRISSK